MSHTERQGERVPGADNNYPLNHAIDYFDCQTSDSIDTLVHLTQLLKRATRR